MLIGDYDPSKPEQPDLSNFLTAEDLQKLQDQIITPSLTLYVDQKNGNDDKDGKSQVTAVRTLDKAVSLIRPNIPTVTINIMTYNEPEDQIYNTFTLNEPINNEKLNIDTFRIIADWENYRQYSTVAKIIVPYGSYNTGAYNYDYNPPRGYKWWGYMFIISPINIHLQSIIFEFPDEAINADKYTNGIIFKLKNSFYFLDCNGATIELKDNCPFFTLINDNDINKIHFGPNANTKGADVTITGTSLLITTKTNGSFIDDPKITDETMPNASMYQNATITKYIIDKSNKGPIFTGNVLGDTKGLSKNINVIFMKGLD